MARIEIDYNLDLKLDEARQAMDRAIKLGLRDTIVDVHRDAVRLSPKKTGHNIRSIASEVSGLGTVEIGEDSEPEKVVDDTKNQAACYSTSGYGGYLETGTSKMSAKPYFRPAMDMHKDELVENIRAHLEVE